MILLLRKALQCEKTSLVNRKGMLLKGYRINNRVIKSEHELVIEEEPFEKFIMVNHNQWIDILLLQAQYITPPSA